MTEDVCLPTRYLRVYLFCIMIAMIELSINLYTRLFMLKNHYMSQVNGQDPGQFKCSLVFVCHWWINSGTFST